MLESEAKEKAKEMIASRNFIFCPLTKTDCMISCECFKKPEVYNVFQIPQKNNYSVRGGFCKAYCLKGPGIE